MTQPADPDSQGDVAAQRPDATETTDPNDLEAASEATTEPQVETTVEPAVDPRTERVAAAVRGWQRELVDLGGRNNLLWYRDLPSGTLDLSTAHPAGVAKLFAGDTARLSDLVREQSAFEEVCRRARLIRAKSVELREERGIATCYLAIGLATWTVSGSSRPPAAPILLRTCTLRPTTPSQRDFDVVLRGEAELNPVLLHYLRSEQGLDFDVPAIEDLASSGGAFDPSPTYAALADLCSGLPDFEVITRLVVGTFSYAKLPMVADLSAQGASLADHDVVAALAGDVTAMRAVRSEVPHGQLDAEPSREHLILDADSTQQAVIDGVRGGANLVIQGPPGTGKSQTIANLIAVLAGEGKRVLFVAEKRAAIDAVLSRLERVGLADLVLDAYEGASSRRAIARSFGAALEAGVEAGNAVPDTTRVERTVRDLRESLSGHVEALHEVRNSSGVSAYAAQEELAAISRRRPAPASHVRVRGEQLAALSRERMEDLKVELTSAAAAGAWASGPEVDRGADPWFGARITSTEEAVKAQEVVGRLSQGGLTELETIVRDVFDDVKLPVAERLTDLADVMAMVARVRQTLEIFRPEVFDIPLDDLVAASGTSAYRSANNAEMGRLERFRLKRDARSLLRPGSPPESLHAALAEAQDQRVAWQQMAGAGGRPEVPGDLEKAQAAYDAVEEDLRWLAGPLSTTAGGGDLLGMPLSDLTARLAALAARPERLSVLPQVTSALDQLAEAGLGVLVADFAARAVPPEEAASELEFVWWSSLLEDITVRDPRYGAHQGPQLRRIADDYVDADREHIGLGPQRVRAAVGRRLVEVLADYPDQESLVRAEAGKARRHRSLRDLLPRAAETLTAIKPCWAMSPLVVASLLPAGRWFDVVIFDEASQIPPAQAVSAISRASQVVVAGDSRQLPPTTFFTTASSEGEGAGGATAVEPESLTEGFESILDVLAAALPSRRLTWHYRSLDERLIAFANSQMYDGSLVTFPSTGQEPVVTLESVDGSTVLTPGMDSVESTDAEVARVVELVLSHARSRPDESLGVIALGIRHAVRLQEALRLALAAEAGLTEFFDEDRPERFFVKNLERVQGDERDAIILSVGYGKTSMGRVLYRFGPLNTDGGERRLNVAVTRARRRMTVVSALRASDLDPERLNARGAQLLKEFLAFAQASGTATVPRVGLGSGSTATADPLRTDFARRLREGGLVVHEGYGGSAHPIDLAIEDPYRRGRLLLAVETDGPLYAAMPATRDRDRLRPEQLARLGWAHSRVWTTDLFRDPAQDVSRILKMAGQLSAGEEDRGGGSDDAPEANEPEVRSGGVPVWQVDDEDRALMLDIPMLDIPMGEDESAVEGRRGVVDGESGEGWAEREPENGREGELEGEDTSERGDEPEGEDVPDRAVRVVKPEQTKDDTDEGWGERPDGGQHDDWLREQRPPHWGSD